MNKQQPYKIDDINLLNIVYSSIKQTEKKKIILIKYGDNGLRNLVFQTPTLLNIHEPNMHFNNNEGYAEIDIALVSKKINKSQKLITFLNNLENKIKNDAMYYGSSWFNSSTRQNINFQKIIKSSDVYENGVLKLKLLKNKNFETITQMNNKEKIKFDILPGNSYVKMIIEVYAVWINNNNDFGVFLRPILVSCTDNNYNYEFIHESEEEHDDIPDTEESNSIFLKSTHLQLDANDSTTNLELHKDNNDSISEQNVLDNHDSTTNLELNKDILDNPNLTLDLELNNISNIEANESITNLELDTNDPNDVEITKFYNLLINS